MTMKKKLITGTAIVTMLIGGAALACDGSGKGGHHRGGHMKEVISQLPEAKQELFREQMESQREAFKGKRDQIKTLHGELKAIVTAETFDKSAFLAKHKEIDALKSQSKAARHASFADLLAQLTPEERKIVADGMKKRGKRGKHDKHGDAAE